MAAIYLASLAAILSFANVIFSYRKYVTIFTPWFFFFSIEVILLHLVSIFSLVWIESQISQREYELFFLCFAAYVFGYSLSYYFTFYPLSKLAAFSVNIVPDFKIETVALVVTLTVYIMAMATLMLAGSAGTLWLTDPRQAYLSYRGATGDGAFYVLALWSLMIAGATWLFWATKKLRTFLIVLAFVLISAYFLGSKQILLSILIFAIFLFERTFARIKVFQIMFLALFCIAIFYYLLTAGQTDQAEFIVAYYFSEYAGNTMKIFSSSLSTLFSPGEFILSSFWEYFPRFLFPDKPYEYGQVLINSILFPGAAQQGVTPGLLFWSPYYLESGLVGVFFFGLSKGLFQRSYFDTLQQKINNPVKSLFLFNASVVPMLLFAPFLYQYIFIFIISALIYMLAGGVKKVRSSARYSFRRAVGELKTQ